VGDPGLAHQLFGHLGLASREGSFQVLESSGGGGGGIGSGIGSGRLVDLLVDSVKRDSRVPWLYPVNRCFAELNRQSMEHVIREEAFQA
jgi:hypothetical protein